MKNKKIKKLKIRRCAIVLIFIILILILIISKINKNNYKKLTILFNNEFIEFSKDVIVNDNQNILFSKDDVQKIFDDTIYYNEVDKELITTYNEHIAVLKLDDENAQIDDENIKLKNKMQVINNQIYLPITDLQVVYDIDLEYSKNSNRIIMDSTTNKKIEASVIKKTKVKSKKGLFSKKIEKLIIGDKVTVLEQIGKYKKVRTSLGNIGYVKNNKLDEEIVIREEKKYDKQNLEVYRNYSNISGIYDNIQVDEEKLNVVIPTFFFLEKDNQVLDKTMNNTATYSVYKTWTDNNKLTILPTFSNNESVSKSLLSYSQRSAVINSLKNQLLNYNYIGINIDFSTVDDFNSFYRFIIELVPRFRKSKLKVAVTLNDNIDRSRIEKIVDYIIEK